MEGKEITIKEDSTPMDYATQFLKYGGKMEDLEKMLELQIKHEKNEAKKAFHVAMSEFKKNPPEILKSVHVKYQNKDKSWTEYDHADLGQISTTVGAALAEHGLSAIWITDQTAGIKVTCTITHALGHSIETSLFSPPDTSGGKNAIQAIGSTINYLQRYTVLALTGLAAHGQDDDGKGTDSAGLPDEVKQEISLLETVDDLNGYYKSYIPNIAPADKQEFVALLAGRKEELAATEGI